MARKSKKSDHVKVKKGYRLKHGYQTVKAKKAVKGVFLFGLAGLGEF
jgi:hypothetical protein